MHRTPRSRRLQCVYSLRDDVSTVETHRTVIKPWTITTTQCYVQTRHSNSLPDTNHPISHAQLQRTKTKERQEDASTTVEDIENHGFEIQGLLGQGSFGLVYGAKIMQELTMIDTMAKSYQIGDRVAIKRMSKRGLLRSVDVDDYHSEDSLFQSFRDETIGQSFLR